MMESFSENWDDIFNVDDILNDKILPSCVVRDEDHDLGTASYLRLDRELSSIDVFNLSSNYLHQKETLQSPVKMSGSLSSKSPWHDSDSGVSDTMSYVGSPDATELEDIAVDPDLIMPKAGGQEAERANIVDDLAAYLLGESNIEPAQILVSNPQDQEQNFFSSESPKTVLVPASGRPRRKCVSTKVQLVDSDSDDSYSEDVTPVTDMSKQKSNTGSLNYFRDETSFRSPGSDIKIVRVVKPPTCGADATAADIIKALNDRSKKNAQQARQNREKKKVYIQGLESELDTLKNENSNLQDENSQMKSEMVRLEDEVHYLKSILANSSALSGLLKNINGVTEVKLSATITGKKRSLEDDHSYHDMVENNAQKRARYIKENLVKAGVCLHVSDGEACLEFCAHCSSLASKTHGRGGSS